MGNQNSQNLEEKIKKLELEQDMKFLEKARNMSEEEMDTRDNLKSIYSRLIISTCFYPFSVLATNRMLNTFI